jgi:hypothetical protein
MGVTNTVTFGSKAGITEGALLTGWNPRDMVAFGIESLLWPNFGWVPGLVRLLGDVYWAQEIGCPWMAFLLAGDTMGCNWRTPSEHS